MQASRPADEDRLPWLEPYREVRPGQRRPARRSRGGLVAAGAVLAILLAGGGGYWLGQRDEPPVAPSASVEVPLPAPQPVPVAPPPAAPAVADPTLIAEPAAPAAKLAAPKRIRSAGVEAGRLKAVRAAQDRPRPKAGAAWPKMPSPGPAGQVIQLGAFTTPTRAHAAYRDRTARYPLLAGMPRVVVPVVSRPGNRILYVLRLGTTSRQQSAIVCRNLVASGDHCLVIG